MRRRASVGTYRIQTKTTPLAAREEGRAIAHDPHQDVTLAPPIEPFERRTPGIALARIPSQITGTKVVRLEPLIVPRQFFSTLGHVVVLPVKSRLIQQPYCPFVRQHGHDDIFKTF